MMTDQFHKDTYAMSFTKLLDCSVRVIICTVVVIQV